MRCACRHKDAKELNSVVLSSLAAATVAAQQVLTAKQAKQAQRLQPLMLPPPGQLPRIPETPGGSSPAANGHHPTHQAPATAHEGRSEPQKQQEGGPRDASLLETLPTLCLQFVGHALLPAGRASEVGSEVLDDDELPEDEAGDAEALAELVQGHEAGTFKLLELLLRLAGQQQVVALAPVLTLAAGPPGTAAAAAAPHTPASQASGPPSRLGVGSRRGGRGSPRAVLPSRGVAVDMEEGAGAGGHRRSMPGSLVSRLLLNGRNAPPGTSHVAQPLLPPTHAERIHKVSARASAEADAHAHTHASASQACVRVQPGAWGKSSSQVITLRTS